MDFNALLNKERAKKQDEQFANQIFGKARRQSAPGGMTNKKSKGAGPAAGSLASRMGISKKPAAPNKAKVAPGRPKNLVNDEWTHDLYSSDSSQRGLNARNRKTLARNAALAGTLNNSASVPNLRSKFAKNNVRLEEPNNDHNQAPIQSAGSGLSIRGIAGNCTVVAQNLAPGTTAADVETALSPIGGTILRCEVTGRSPAVTAEVVFETKEGAVSVVESFNNRTADGRIIRLWIKPPTSPSATIISRTGPTIPTGPRAGNNGNRNGDRYVPGNRRENNRPERADANINIVDGSYGFEDTMDTDENENRPEGSALYSDSMPNNRRQYSGRGGRGGRRGQR